MIAGWKVRPFIHRNIRISDLEGSSCVLSWRELIDLGSRIHRNETQERAVS